VISNGETTTRQAQKPPSGDREKQISVKKEKKKQTVGNWKTNHDVLVNGLFPRWGWELVNKPPAKPALESNTGKRGFQRMGGNRGATGERRVPHRTRGSKANKQLIWGRSLPKSAEVSLRIRGSVLKKKKIKIEKVLKRTK